MYAVLSARRVLLARRSSRAQGDARLDGVRLAFGEALRATASAADARGRALVVQWIRRPPPKR